MPVDCAAALGIQKYLFLALFLVIFRLLRLSLGLLYFLLLQTLLFRTFIIGTITGGVR